MAVAKTFVLTTFPLFRLVLTLSWLSVAKVLMLLLPLLPLPWLLALTVVLGAMEVIDEEQEGFIERSVGVTAKKLDMKHILTKNEMILDSEIHILRTEYSIWSILIACKYRAFMDTLFVLQSCVKGNSIYQGALELYIPFPKDVTPGKYVGYVCVRPATAAAATAANGEAVVGDVKSVGL